MPRRRCTSDRAVESATLSHIRAATMISFCGLLAAGGPGCGPSRPEQIAAFLRAHEQEVSAGTYRVKPPDALEFQSPQALEIDQDVQVIRSDGKVSLRLVGEVKVAGLTPREIADKVETLLAKYYVDPKVHVRVLSALSKRYFVFGEVQSPGAYPYTGNDSLIRALALAQPTFLAWKARIKVLRPSPDRAERRELVINADELINEGNTESNVLLQEGDIIFVPPTPTAWVGLRLRELLYPVAAVGSTVAAPVDVRDTGSRYDQPALAGGGGGLRAF